MSIEQHYYIEAIEEEPRPRPESNIYHYAVSKPDLKTGEKTIEPIYFDAGQTTVSKPALKTDGKSVEPIYFDAVQTNRSQTVQTNNSVPENDLYRPRLPIPTPSRQKRSFGSFFSKRKRVKIIIIAAGIAIVCALLAIGLTLGFLHDRKSKPVIESNSTVTTLIPRIFNYTTI